MKFSWENRSEHDQDVIELVNSLLIEKLVCLAQHMVKSERLRSFDEFSYFDSSEASIGAAMRLLEVDMEWLFGFIQRDGSEPLLFGNRPMRVLPVGWSFAMRRESLCGDSTPTFLCCPYDQVYIVKDADPAV